MSCLCGCGAAVTLSGHYRRPPLADRFWAKVRKGPDPDGCWEWTGVRANNRGGYGYLWVNGRNERAQRVSWQLHNGPIPAGLFVLHHCDNPPCVRPDHLFVGTNRDNALDGMAKGRWPTGETHGSAKLTTVQVLAARERHAAGESAHAIARSFGIGHQAIHQIVHRKTWRNV